MSLDIRIPIGLLFCIIAAILIVFGLCTWRSEMYTLSLGYNINLIWGGVLGIFGIAMLALARRASRRKKGHNA
jgi:steroid 5-alpha reductase family enzyme